MTTITTIGVYGLTVDAFLATLADADVRVLLDVRQRRGVRGSDYAWANVGRLRAALADAGIAYEHHRELAPTTELRHLQYLEDDRQGVGKRTRRALAASYMRRYTAEILDKADLDAVIAALPSAGSAALFCVEGSAAACHRSLIAQRLADRYGFGVRHLPSRSRGNSVGS